jgi:hypothetical protein
VVESAYKESIDDSRVDVVILFPFVVLGVGINLRILFR